MQIFGFFEGPRKIKILDFIEIENCFVNKKVDNRRFMAKSQFLLNPMEYFSKIWQKSTSHFSQIFFNISQSTGQKSVKISVVSIFSAISSISIEFSWKNTKIKKNISLHKRRWFDVQKSAKCVDFWHARRRDQTL